MARKVIVGLVMACVVMVMASVVMVARAQEAVSPNGRLTLRTEGQEVLVCRDGQQVLTLTGMPFEAKQGRTPLQFVGQVKADYQMLSGKRRHCTNEANEYRAVLVHGECWVVRLYNDGLAFRYEYSNLRKGPHPTEPTAYRIPEGMRRWMQQWTDSYEGFFPLTTTYRVDPVPSYSAVSKSPEGYNNRWGYPALLEPVDGVFVLISEANIERRQSASYLQNDGEIYRVKPAENEVSVRGEWHTPWRVAIVGGLKDVVESTLVTDVSEPCQLDDTRWIQPGVVSWVYWAYNHGSNDFRIIKKYVDMAATLHLPYVLIDAEWDTMKDGYTIEDAVRYAKSQGVKPLIWYNSSVGWVDGAPTPKFRLNKAEEREKEFAWCEQLGVAGVKIDFFSGDNQMNMDYCLNLLECAARHHLLVNFHGATVPRGWQRTYPNLLSTEGVYGAEWYNNVATFTAQAAAHNATLPFTRNVVGPMDYTPCAFSDSQHPHITTHAHELALTVLFESGLQHLADKPESYFAQPKEVWNFLSTLPAAWDETRFVSGYPGESVVLARRSGDTWYVAGINGTDSVKEIPLPLGDVAAGKGHVVAFLDSGDEQEKWNIRPLDGALPPSLTCQPRGGFVLVVNGHDRIYLAASGKDVRVSEEGRAPTPQLEYVMQLRVAIGEAYEVGARPQGNRYVVPITGGTFEGPLLRGTILSGGADYQLRSPDGSHTSLEAIYSIRTDDGVCIHVRNQGIISTAKDEHGQDSFYFKAAPRFEAPTDSPYAWLNHALFVCSPTSSPDGSIFLDVWKVK